MSKQGEEFLKVKWYTNDDGVVDDDYSIGGFCNITNKDMKLTTK